MPTKFVTNPRRSAAKKARVPMRRNYASADNYLRGLRPAQVERLVREGSLDITYSDIGNGYHTVTLFEQGQGENYRQVEAKWFVKGDDAWYDLSLGLRDGKVDPSTADLFLGPSRWDKREREEQTRAAAKRKGIDIDASRHYFNNPSKAKKSRTRRKNPASPRPSVKTLSQVVTPAEAKELRNMMEYTGPTGVLRAASRMMDGFDVIYLNSRNDTMRTPDGLEFVNMGDTYDLTLAYDHGKGKYLVTTWGDIVEADARLPASRRRFD
jgi:hypothetical protein